MTAIFKHNNINYKYDDVYEISDIQNRFNFIFSSRKFSWKKFKFIEEKKDTYDGGHGFYVWVNGGTGKLWFYDRPTSDRIILIENAEKFPPVNDELINTHKVLLEEWDNFLLSKKYKK